MRVGWHDSPISYGAIGRLTCRFPICPTMHVSSVQLDPLGVAVWLSDLPDGRATCPTRSPGSRHRRTRPPHVSSSGRILPDDARRKARSPSAAGCTPPNGPDDTLVGDTLTALAESMPPVCTHDSGADVAQIFDRLVDGIARACCPSGWRPELGKLRRPELQALRATFGALSKPDQVIRGNTDEFDVAIDHLRAELERHRRRAGGEPVVIPRLRLIVPDDPLEPWTVRLELVDDRDASRWCTANDVWERSASAIDVAREARYVDLLVDVIGDTVTRVAFIPGLADLALEHEPTAIELELDVAEDFIDIAPAELERLGIDLIGPERLVKTRVSVSGQASATPADDRKKQFGHEALVDWKLVVGDETISEAELARAAEAGATLLHTGHRWVRIDADELRRKRLQLTALRKDHSRVDPLELLQLANADDSDDEHALITLADPSQSDEAEPLDLDWVRTLLDGLPDEVLEETHESPRLHRRTPPLSAPRPVRGCSSSPSSASAVASPTTWASARPPPRSPTSSNDPGRTSSCAR